MDLLNKIFIEIHQTLTSFESRLAVFYLILTILIVAVLWVVRGRPTSFLAYLLPKEVYRHKSNIVDIKIFLFNAVLSGAGVFAAVTMTPLMTTLVLDSLLDMTGSPMAPVDDSWPRLALATIIMILTLDFCKYWAHRLHHETTILWPFHALHHSAEVMTPLTANRNHPVFLILRQLIYTVIVGSVQALMLFLLMGKIEVLTIGTVNAGYFLFNALGSNLRHSHVWLSYGPVLEHILISPAQHHIHHSIERKHYNKNYGEVFAIWDLMFGTLYVPKGYENLSFGLSNHKGERIEQPYPTLRSALLDPFAESWHALKKGTRWELKAKELADRRSAS